MLVMLLLACDFATSSQQVYAITVGELADFNSGTDGWEHGQGAWPILSGGQLGASDNFLSIQASSGLNPIRFISLNRTSEWTGDYTAAGVTDLQFDILNESGTTLEIRFSVNGPGGLFSTTTSASIPSSSRWQNASVSFDPNNFSPVSGRSGPSGTNIEATLGNVSELRILHNANPSWTGQAAQLTAGFDNIEALGAAFDPADFDQNGFVDGDDLADWQTAYGSDPGADANGDGLTDGDDFIIWQQNFAPEPPMLQAVPEPASLALVLAVPVACFAYRRPRH
ncbi:MAG: hypothetical protein RH917_07670 [Lacipirellulaceae bacterium]